MSKDLSIAGFSPAEESGSISQVTRKFYKHSDIEEIPIEDYKLPLGETLKILHKLPKKAASLTDYDAVIYPSISYASSQPPKEIFSVIYIHDLYALTKESNFITTYLRGRILQNLIKFDLILANSRHTKSVIEGIMFDEGSVEVVSPGIDDFYSEVSSVKRDENILLYVGSFQERKNTKFLIDVLEELPETYSLVCAGRYSSEDKKNEFIKYAEENGISHRIEVIGECSKEKLRELYSSAGFYFHPAKKGGYEITPLEASACGSKVIVNSNIPSAEALDDRHIIFDNFNASELAEKIMSKPNYDFADDSTTWDDARDNLVSTINEKVNKYEWD